MRPKGRKIRPIRESPKSKESPKGIKESPKKTKESRQGIKESPKRTRELPEDRKMESRSSMTQE